MAESKARKKPESGARSAVTAEEAHEVGFFGQEVDPTPDANYTVAGQSGGTPTPAPSVEGGEK